METLFVRLKPHDPRRGHLLRRYTFSGIKFQEDHGWYRVPEDVAQRLREVRQQPLDRFSPPAFDVCTEAEAKAIDDTEQAEATSRKKATGNVKVSQPRGSVTTADLPDQPAEPKPAKTEPRRAKKA
jgi:hypothetical protein